MSDTLDQLCINTHPLPADAKGIATRVASGKVMNAIALRVPAKGYLTIAYSSAT